MINNIGVKKMSQEGQWVGWARKGACCQVWCPEFNPLRGNVVEGQNQLSLTHTMLKKREIKGKKEPRTTILKSSVGEGDCWF